MDKKFLRRKIEIDLTVLYPDGFNSEARNDLEALEDRIKEFAESCLRTANNVNKYKEYHKDIELKMSIN